MGGWKPVVLTVAACCAALIPLVYVLVPERPASIGLRSFCSQHDDHPAPPAQGNPFTAAFSNLARAATTRAFWFLFTTFFICGFTTNGLVGTHLIAFCSDHGIVEVQAASLLALMGFWSVSSGKSCVAVIGLGHFGDDRCVLEREGIQIGRGTADG